MSKQQLTIEHLAPYLPYNVGVTWEAVSGLVKNVFLDIESSDDLYEGTCGVKYISVNDVLEMSYKPILRPLSDLTFEDIDNLKDQYDVQVNDEGVEMYRDKDNSINPLEWRYEDIQYLLRRHFDVFSLIEKGLAININDLDDDKRRN